MNGPTGMAGHATITLAAAVLAMPAGAGEVRNLALQNEYSQLPVCEHGVTNRAWTIGGFPLGAPIGIDIPGFLAFTDEALRDRLSNYLTSHPELDAATSDWLILDIEHPVHPRNLGRYIDEDAEEYDPDLFVDLVEAFKLRIAVARDVFENARLGLYGTIVPDGRGRDESDGFIQRINGYLAAGELGLYDALDRLVPVLYQRFGPDDPFYDTIDDATRQAIVQSRRLTTSSGDPVPLLPLLGFKIANGNSGHDGEQVRPTDLAMQIDIIRAEGERVFAFWSGSDDSAGEPLTIPEFFDLLFCPPDVSGPSGFPDGTVGFIDLLAVLNEWGRDAGELGCMADVSCDGVVGLADLLAILAAWGSCP